MASDSSIGSRSSSSHGDNDVIELLDASFEGRVEDVVRILKKCYSLLEQDSDDCSLLEQDSDGNTALHLAAKEGHGSIVSKMIDLLLTSDKGVYTLDVRNHEEDTPLYLALLAGYNEIALNLVNADRRKHRELTQKIQSSWTEVVSVGPEIVSGGAPFEGDPFEGQEVVDDIIQILEKDPGLIFAKRDSDCNTIFHTAAKKGHRDTVSKMINLFMEVDCSWLTGVLHRRNLDEDRPLYLALLAGYNEIALDLVNADREAAAFIALNYLVLENPKEAADVDVNMRLNRVFEDKDEYEDTLPKLQKAAEVGETERAGEILQKNLSLLQRPDEQGRTFVHIAASNGNVEMLKLVKVKVLKCLMLRETKEGDTALDLSLLGGHEMAAYYLIQVHPRAGYQPNTKGDSPLSMAIDRLYNPDLVRHITTCPKQIKKSLLQHAQNKELAHVAVKTNNLAVLQALMDGLPDLMESKDKDGRSPLSFAAYEGYYQQVRYFCEKFADFISKCDGTGSSPIHQAIAGGHLTIVKEILPRCPKPIHDHVDNDNRNIEYYATNSKNKEKMLPYLKKKKII